MGRFSGKVLIIGYGAVGRALLPLITRHLKTPPGRITIVDMAQPGESLRRWRRNGLRFLHQRITHGNLRSTLSPLVSPGDLIIDLAWSIDCLEILAWLKGRGVYYVNASIEEWDPYASLLLQTSFHKSLYKRYTRLLTAVPRWHGQTTALIDHGANPGLISHFLKKGLMDIGARLIRSRRRMGKTRRKAIERAMEKADFARLAMLMGVRSVHCSERDTQTPAAPRRPNEFVGVWSIEAMTSEAVSPTEIGWGTHEKKLPHGAMVPRQGPRNQIVLPQMGMNTWIRSWAPSREFVGMAITHGESFTISKFLTLSKNGKPVYRPTVHFVYLPSNETVASLHELRCRGYEHDFRNRIMTDEIRFGQDSVGALIMGHPYSAWWTGSILDIDRARELVPRQNATTVQVAIGVVAGALWVLDNPRRGICFPEDLPHEQILKTARPYLGRFVSQPVNWTPLKNYRMFFTDNPDLRPDMNDPWQFKNFVFKP